jgi:hypothetical protein
MWACGFRSWPTPPALENSGPGTGTNFSHTPSTPTPDVPHQVPRSQLPQPPRAALYFLTLLPTSSPPTSHLATESSGASSTGTCPVLTLVSLVFLPLPVIVVLYTTTVRVRTGICSSRKDLGPGSLAHLACSLTTRWCNRAISASFEAGSKLSCPSLGLAVHPLCCAVLYVYVHTRICLRQRQRLQPCPLPVTSIPSTGPSFLVIPGCSDVSARALAIVARIPRWSCRWSCC